MSLELLPASEPDSDPDPPDPVIREAKSTLLPPPVEPLLDASLESLARALRRA